MKHSRTMLSALQKIARGKIQNGLPLNARLAQEVARAALVEVGETWTDHQDRVMALSKVVDGAK